MVSVLIFVAFLSCKTDDNETPTPGTELEISAIEVEMNPSGRAPLTAMLRFSTAASARISITIPGKNPLVKEFSEMSMDHEIPLMGLYANTVNYVIVNATDDSGNAATEVVPVETGELPEYLPEIEITTKQEGMMEPGWNLLPVTIGLGAPNSFSNPTVFDEDGDVRWYMDLRDVFATQLVSPVEPMNNGNFLFASQRAIHEYNLMGFEVNSWALPNNYLFHHDVIEKPNGNFIVAVDDSNLNTIEDIAIEIDRNTGETVNVWDLREILDMNRTALFDDQRDWFHMNAIWYDEVDDAVIFSGQRQGLVKVSNDNELIWILAPHKGWGPAGINADGHDTNDFLLTAVDAGGTPYQDEVQQGDMAIDEFEWVWGQHAPMILENGNLFAYDNGFSRNFGPLFGTYSRGVEYEIDEQAMTVRQVWQAGKEKGVDFQSHIISDVDVMGQTGNRIIFSGINIVNNESRLMEVTYPMAMPVFEATIKYRRLFVEDGAPLRPGNLDSSFRMERISMYSGY